jgi:hypothetical protein
MKKMLMVTVAVVTLSTPAFSANTIPTELRGDWCQSKNGPDSDYEIYFPGCSSYPNTTHLTVYLYGYHLIDESCTVTDVRGKGRKYRIASTCGSYKTIYTAWLDGSVLHWEFEPIDTANAPEYKACHGGNIAACKRWRDRACRDGNRAACDYDEAQRQADPSGWCTKRHPNEPASQYRFCVNGSPDR